MTAVGFSHFASVAPNHLALVTPDGRHWSRAELQAESRRIAGCAPAQLRHTSPDDYAGYLAMRLTTRESAQHRGQADGSPQGPGHPAGHVILPIGIDADHDHSLYLGVSLADTGASAWALAGLERGMPLILTRHWEIEHFCRTVKQYRVSGCYLSGGQFEELISSPPSLAHRYNLRSLHEIAVDGEVTPLPSILATGDSPGESCL